MDELKTWAWAQANTVKLAVDANRDIVAYECLANDPLYAKPDTEKSFILWEVPKKTKGIVITEGDNVQTDHKALYKLFVTPDVVRFPFNVADSELGGGKSLSWYDAIVASGVDGQGIVFRRLPRWSTASRSCFALIPDDIDALEELDGGAVNALVKAEGVAENRYDFKIPDKPIGQDEGALHMVEWSALKKSVQEKSGGRRFHTVVKDPGEAASSGLKVKGVTWRLYSVKTGISFVGSKSELGAHKNRLEANSTMAMLRSSVMDTLPNKDKSLGIQTEVLTVTALAVNEADKSKDEHGNDIRDGFQVRDLSCMLPKHVYLPGQSIPYVRHDFDGGFTSREVLALQRRLRLNTPVDSEVGRALADKDLDHESVAKTEAERHCDFWRSQFTYPLGRAKARLFLNYGLIHTSANAQNFVLGFKGSTLKQFVLRDVGDTSWHDVFVTTYGKGTEAESAFIRESKSDHVHTLKTTSSGDYPAPYIVRLAAWSLLTHGFGDKLNWTKPQLYYFVTGAFDGFIDYIIEAFGVHDLNKLATGQLKQKPIPSTVADDIKTLGTHCRYPYDQPKKKTAAYRSAIDTVMKATGGELLGRAVAVRKAGIKSLGGTGTAYAMENLVAAEETLLCAAVERLLFKEQAMKDMPTFQKTIRTRIKDGKWPAVVPPSP